MDNEKYENLHETKEHTPAGFPYNTYLCSIPKDFGSVKLHWHNEIEVIVIKKGCGIVSVDLVRYDVKAGDTVFVFSGQLHSIEQKDDFSMEYENIIFKADLLKSSGTDIYSDNFLRPFLDGEIKINPLVCSEEINSIISEVDELCDKRPYGYRLAVKGNLFRVMFHLVKKYSTDDFKPAAPKTLEKMKTVITYIEENYQDRITIDEIAAKVYYSKSYFMKFFKNATGKAFIEYINDFRLTKAAAALQSSDNNIIDIASSIGFDNLSYFNRSFKRKFGVAPGEYRKNFGFTSKAAEKA